MCGRFTQMMSWADLVRLLEGRPPQDQPLLPNFNVAPSQQVPIIRNGESGREATLMKWGLVPSWADSPSIGYRMINARAETVASKPAFRAAFKRRRCLIPANGFYEWRKPATKGEKKQPFYIRLKEDRPFAFAGLWERWDKSETPLESCTIITCGPNELLRQIHDRMPVILPEEHYDRWLTGTDPDELQSLLMPLPADRMLYYPVSTRVNSPSFNKPECLEPLRDGADAK